MQVSHTTGDISFYNTAGTTPKFFWDASAETLGIGTSSPATKLDISRGTDTTGYVTTQDQRSEANLTLRNESETNGTFAGINFYVGGGTGSDWSINNVRTGNYAGDLTFKTRAGGGSTDWRERMKIDNAGNMGIKQTTPVNLLHIGGADGDSYARFTSDSTGHTSGDGTRIGLNGTDFRIVNHEASNILFLTSNTERMSVSDTTVKHNGQSQLGSGWSQLKQYNWSGSIAQGAYVDLFENSGAHNDLMFYFFVKGYHSNRTFGVIQGAVGGYGLGYTWTGATGMNLSPSVSNAGSGRNKLRMTNSSAYSGSFYITGWIAGSAGITIHTGSLAG
jgi:hypothetical protein